MILEINKNVLVEEAVEMLEESLKGRVKSALKSLNPARKSITNAIKTKRSERTELLKNPSKIDNNGYSNREHANTINQQTKALSKDKASSLRFQRKNDFQNGTGNWVGNKNKVEKISSKIKDTKDNIISSTKDAIFRATSPKIETTPERVIIKSNRKPGRF